jgi:glutamate racemase
VGDREVAVIDSGEAVEKRVESLLDKFDLRCAEDNSPKLEFLSYADEEYRSRLERKALR